MNTQRVIVAVVLLILLGGAVAVYRTSLPTTLLPTPVSSAQEKKFLGKKVFYIDSYHAGYDWSDGVLRGIKQVLGPTGITLQVFHMDTKQHPDEAYKKDIAEKVRVEVDKFAPDILLVSDDNALKYVVAPFYRDTALPVAFSGINWDEHAYGMPYTNMTGMIEVSLTGQIIDHLKNYSKGKRLGYLSADTETERNNLKFYGSLLGITVERSYFVKTMTEWEVAYTKLQSEVDMVIFENNAGIKDWDAAVAKKYVLEHTSIPVGTTNAWMIDYALLGITKLPEEQGEWQAQAALRILGGESPRAIPITRNKRGNLVLNLPLADKMQIIFTPDVLKNATNIK